MGGRPGYNNIGGEADRAQSQAFVDTWEWGPEAVAALNSDRQREKAEIGILITMDAGTPAMRKEVAAAGKYKHPMLQREDDRIQIVTIEDILAGKRIELPMGRTDTVKSADAVGDAKLQQALL